MFYYVLRVLLGYAVTRQHQRRPIDAPFLFLRRLPVGMAHQSALYLPVTLGGEGSLDVPNVDHDPGD